MKRAKIVAIYGITNLGKSTQCLRLKNHFNSQGLKCEIVKYPRYDLEPTGPRIYNYIKKDNPEKLTPFGFQKLQVKNRQDFEDTLLQMAEDNDILLLEMYIGTGIAYGMGDGISKQAMIEMNKGLLEPDMSLLLNGKRFMESKESNHVFEQDDEKTERIRNIHLELAQDFNWPVIKSDESEEEVSEALLFEISKCLSKLEDRAV